MRLLSDTGPEDARGVELAATATAEQAVQFIENDINQTLNKNLLIARQPDKYVLAAFASRIKKSDAQQLLQEAVEKARSGGLGSEGARTAIVALAAGVDPTLAGWNETRMKYVTELLKPTAGVSCGKMPCPTNANLDVAEALAFANGPLTTETAGAFASAITEECAPNFSFPADLYQTDEGAGAIAAALLHTGRGSCLAPFLNNPAFPAGALRRIIQQDRPAILALLPPGFLWQSYELASQLGRGPDADAAFEKLLPHSQPWINYSLPQATLAALVTDKKAAELWKAAKFCRADTSATKGNLQFEYPVCTVLRMRNREDFRDSLRTNLAALQADGGPGLIGYLASGLSSNNRLDILRTALLQKIPMSPIYLPYRENSEEPTLAILNSAEDLEPLKDALKKVWVDAADGDKANLINSALYTWAAILGDDLPKNRPLFIDALKAQRPIYARAIRGQWRELLTRVVPDAAERSRIILELALPLPQTPDSQILPPLPPPQVLSPVLGVLSPDADPDAALLSLLTLEGESEAWERIKRFDLNWTLRQKIAAQLCELHHCRLDMRNRWNIAEFALERNVDLTRAPTSSKVASRAAN